MKKILRALVMLGLLIGSSTSLFAQEEESLPPSTPKWISNDGYWVIESNVKSKDTSTIHFYNNDNVLMYSEKVEGITLNLKNRRTLMRLKKALDQTLIAWQQTQVSKDNAQLVRNIFEH